MKYSACLEWLFADESESFAGRIRLAKKAKLDAVEFWLWSNKNLDEIEAALTETGLTLTGFVAEPMIALTDPANRARFLDGLAETVKVAKRLRASNLIAQAGADQAGLSRSAQRDALTRCLSDAAKVLAGTGVRLAVEPLNTLIDHKGYFLPSTREGLDIVDDVGRPEIRLIYDVYHSAVMSESTPDVVGDRVDRISHVHLADHPGRHEPGSGGIDLVPRVQWLVGNGYQGALGLEYRPTRPTSVGLPDVVALFG
jgi:hydroxypyruvate isomerase